MLFGTGVLCLQPAVSCGWLAVAALLSSAVGMGKVAWEALLAQAQANRDQAQANGHLAQAMLLAMPLEHDCSEPPGSEELQAWVHVLMESWPLAKLLVGLAVVWSIVQRDYQWLIAVGHNAENDHLNRGLHTGLLHASRLIHV